MTILPISYNVGNAIEFIGATGFMGVSQTEFGVAIDVADNRVNPCLWVYVVPVNVDVLSIHGRTPYRIRGVVVRSEIRPVIVGMIEPP